MKKVKENISNIKDKHGIAAINSSELLAARKEEHELAKSSHPGFVISFDNLDFQLKRRNMTKDSQNQDHHWVNHQMVENRVSGNSLDVKQPNAEDIVNIPNTRFLPNIYDQQHQRLNYIILTSRILVSYFEALKPLQNACIFHIPHKYTMEMSQKSKKVCNISIMLILWS